MRGGEPAGLAARRCAGSHPAIAAFAPVFTAVAADERRIVLGREEGSNIRDHAHDGRSERTAHAFPAKFPRCHRIAEISPWEKQTRGDAKRSVGLCCALFVPGSVVPRCVRPPVPRASPLCSRQVTAADALDRCRQPAAHAHGDPHSSDLGGSARQRQGFSRHATNRSGSRTRMSQHSHLLASSRALPLSPCGQRVVIVCLPRSPLPPLSTSFPLTHLRRCRIVRPASSWQKASRSHYSRRSSRRTRSRHNNRRTRRRRSLRSSSTPPSVPTLISTSHPRSVRLAPPGSAVGPHAAAGFLIVPCASHPCSSSSHRWISGSLDGLSARCSVVSG